MASAQVVEMLQIQPDKSWFKFIWTNHKALQDQNTVDVGRYQYNYWAREKEIQGE